MKQKAYELMYKDMPETEREKLRSFVGGIMEESAKRQEGVLKREVEKAVSELYSGIMCNPWPSVVKENGSEFELLTAISEHVWTKMLNSRPDDNQYDLREFVEAWRVNWPDHFKQTLDSALVDENARLREDLQREIQFNRRQF